MRIETTLMTLALYVCSTAAADTFTNSAGMVFTPIPAGTFTRGGDQGDFDEKPAHEARISKPFAIAISEVTWAQYEEFNPSHSRFRNRDKVSSGDSDPAVFISWHDAARYCEWLSQKEKKPYRLPTEAEWEYVGITKPEILHSAAKVENWCHDWYGPYPSTVQVDPRGYQTGDSRVTRGGIFRATNNLPNMANRHANLPADRNRALGFRLVQGDMPAGAFLTERPKPRWARDVSSREHQWKAPVDMRQPWFAEPVPYVKIPAGANGPLFHEHNHDPALAWCPNGDLLAIWYSTIKEVGRELTIAASRLRNGGTEWDEADLFWDVPDRNDHAPALLTASDGTLYHWNGLGVGETWRELALIQRTSADNGATWSAARIIQPDHGFRNMPIPSPFERRDGTLVLPCDAHPSGNGGTALHISADRGGSWVEHGRGKEVPKFAAGMRGDWIAGIHAPVAEWTDGSLIALGRGDSIASKMPMSISRDDGRTWEYSASEFPTIGGGQRAVLRRLREGPLMLISFASKGMEFKDANGETFQGNGMFAALSEDGGKTWPIRKMMTDGKKRELDGMAWTKTFTTGQTNAEPKGYLTAVQTPDGVIQLISSGIHYRFNLAWLKQPNVVSARTATN